MHAAVADLAPVTGVAAACRLLDVPRATYYRQQLADAPCRPATRGRTERCAPRALSREERAHIRTVLNSERFVDCAPREVYATLLDEGTYLCAWPTMYRLLREADEVQRRRDQRRQGAYAKPELLATQPNQLWSWDSTKLKGPTTWSYYFLYVILDVSSRYVVGWMIAERESAALAETFIAETCAKEAITSGQLTIHADRGSAMTRKCVAHLLADLGVTKTHSRPQVSNDNPFSEAQFKTAKYHSTTPARFGSVADARAWARELFRWYNQAHHHTGIALLTPATVHHGRADAMLAARQTVVTAAYAAHPERFVRGAPRPAALPAAVWINPPVAGGTTDPRISAAATEPTVSGEPSGVPVSSGDRAQRPLDTGTPAAMLRPACSVPRQTDTMLPHSRLKLSHAA